MGAARRKPDGPWSESRRESPTPSLPIFFENREGACKTWSLHGAKALIQDEEGNEMKNAMVFIALALLLSACNLPFLPAPTPTSTATLPPSSTPIPTLTPTASTTPTTTLSPTVTPSITATFPFYILFRTPTPKPATPTPTSAGPLNCIVLSQSTPNGTH